MPVVVVVVVVAVAVVVVVVVAAVVVVVAVVSYLRDNSVQRTQPVILCLFRNYVDNQ